MVALNEWLRRKKALWRPAGRAQLESLTLAPWASRRRQDLLDLLDHLTPKIQELTRTMEEIVEKRSAARRLRTHPGVGPLTRYYVSGKIQLHPYQSGGDGDDGFASSLEVWLYLSR